MLRSSAFDGLHIDHLPLNIVPEIEKALAELQRLMAYRRKEGLNENFLGLGLTSRRNLCVHPEVNISIRTSLKTRTDH
jgi:hypothetical protein